MEPCRDAQQKQFAKLHPISQRATLQLTQPLRLCKQPNQGSVTPHPVPCRLHVVLQAVTTTLTNNNNNSSRKTTTRKQVKIEQVQKCNSALQHVSHTTRKQCRPFVSGQSCRRKHMQAIQRCCYGAHSRRCSCISGSKHSNLCRQRRLAGRHTIYNAANQPSCRMCPASVVPTRPGAQVPTHACGEKMAGWRQC